MICGGAVVDKQGGLGAIWFQHLIRKVYYD